MAVKESELYSSLWASCDELRGVAHLLERTHNPRFVALMDRFLPAWRSVRQTLNRLPVRREDWDY